jgi:hypothetical protein
MAFAAGCGDGDESSSRGLASFVPPDVPLYAEGAIRPEGDQAEAVESFAERIGGVDDPGAAIEAKLDQTFSDNGLELTYADDVEPWLGRHAAVFVSSFDDSGGTPDFAVMVDVEDADAASEFLQDALDQSPSEVEERSYEGNDYFLSGGMAVGVLDDEALALGTETGLMVAIDAAAGESLAESDEFTGPFDQLPDDALASMFFEPAAAIEASIAQGDVDPAGAQALEPLFGGPLSKPVAATVQATDDAATFETATAVDDSTEFGTDTDLLAGLPGGSWFAAAIPDLGDHLQGTLDQLSSSGIPGAGQIEQQVRQATGLDLGEDVVGWLGDVTAYIEGTGVPGFRSGLIAQTSDPEAPRPLLDALQAGAERDSGIRSSGTPDGADYGFSIGVPGVGGGFEAGVASGQLVAVLGATIEQALNPSETLADNPAFEEAVSALGDDFAPALFVSLPEFFQVAESGADGDVDYDAIRPYVGALSTLVAGAQVDAGYALTRVTLSLADE